MTFGLNMSVPKMRKLHPADDLLYWLTFQVSETHPLFPDKIKFTEVKERLHELYDTAYKLGYEQGTEDAHEESRRPLGK